MTTMGTEEERGMKMNITLTSEVARQAVFIVVMEDLVSTVSSTCHVYMYY